MDSGTSRNSLLASVVHHIILPPKIPPQEDLDHPLSEVLAKRVIAAAETLRNHAGSDHVSHWESFVSSLKASLAIHTEGQIDGETLHDRFRELSCSRILILHVACQNAGIVVYRKSK
jgi:hypothetical protein